MISSYIPALSAHPPWVPVFVRSAAFVIALVVAGCTSDSSSGGPSADSSVASTATAVAERSAPTAADPVPIDEGDDRTVAQKLKDASIQTRVKRALIRTSNLRVFPFRPRVSNGHVVLRGDVNTPDQYRQAERIAGRVDGVNNVTNQLTMGGRPVTEDRLASKEDASSEDAAVFHTVQQGDTLWDIAREYRASVEQIKNLNDFRSGTLRPGQRIRIR